MRQRGRTSASRSTIPVACQRGSRRCRCRSATTRRAEPAARVAGREPRTGAGGGSGGGTAPSDKGKADAAKLIRRYRGRAEDALASVIDENAEYREERRQLRAKLPKEGEVVLSAADAAAFNAYKALGTPEVVKQKVDEHGTLSARIASDDRAKIADEAAPLAGFNPAALRDIVRDKGLELSFAEETVDGKAVRVPMVKLASDAAAKPVKLAEYAKTSLATYLPALTAKPAGTNGAAPAAATGTTFPEQGSSSSATGTAGQNNGTPRGPAPIPGVKPYVGPWEQPAAAAK
jgi:hypothetical protein